MQLLKIILHGKKPCTTLYIKNKIIMNNEDCMFSHDWPCNVWLGQTCSWDILEIYSCEWRQWGK